MKITLGRTLPKSQPRYQTPWMIYLGSYKDPNHVKESKEPKGSYWLLFWSQDGLWNGLEIVWEQRGFTTSNLKYFNICICLSFSAAQNWSGERGNLFWRSSNPTQHATKTLFLHVVRNTYVKLKLRFKQSNNYLTCL